jgi:pyrophosphate--fructose-6-phosphate 1-phosphotransferase
MSAITALQQERLKYQPQLPAALARNGARIAATKGEIMTPPTDQEALQEKFQTTYGVPVLKLDGDDLLPEAAPITVGVILSGGQAPGGHNVVAGIFDGLKSLNPNNRLFGFLRGPKGLVDRNYTELTEELIDAYRNTGGFDIIGSGRDKIESDNDVALALESCHVLGIKALVVIGGDDSNTNACILAEAFAQAGSDVQVVGCPKTIDGDLKNEYIETSFGFDTACKVYSELVGNLMRDAMSARKYWHFVRLMGRSASHITLECALQTRPNVAIMSEEVLAKKQTLAQIVDQFCDVIEARAAKGWNFGVALIPEGLIEFIPAFKLLISDLNHMLAENPVAADALQAASSIEDVEATGLSGEEAELYLSLPADIKAQLVLDRDAHGNVQVSRIETEKLLVEMIEERLVARAGEDKPPKFSPLCHFFGYEGRCAPPTNFDATYCYGLGYVAAALIGNGATGYIASLRDLVKPAAEWDAGGIPLTSMMNVEVRHGKPKPVIKKALVESDGAPFKYFVERRDEWAVNNAYLYAGPIQYFGPTEISDQPSITLKLESE